MRTSYKRAKWIEIAALGVKLWWSSRKLTSAYKCRRKQTEEIEEFTRKRMRDGYNRQRWLRLNCAMTSVLSSQIAEAEAQYLGDCRQLTLPFGWRKRRYEKRDMALTTCCSHTCSSCVSHARANPPYSHVRNTMRLIFVGTPLPMGSVAVRFMHGYLEWLRFENEVLCTLCVQAVLKYASRPRSDHSERIQCSY